MKDERKFSKRHVNAVLKIIRLYRLVTIKKIEELFQSIPIEQRTGMRVKNRFVCSNKDGWACCACDTCEECGDCILRINGILCSDQPEYKAMREATNSKDIMRALNDRADFIEKSLIKRGII